MKRLFLALAVALAVTPALAQKGGKPAPLTPLAWYDSTGKLVGHAFPGDGAALTAAFALLNIGTDVIQALMFPTYGPVTYPGYTFDGDYTPGRYLIGSSGTLYYSGADCSGSAYVYRNIFVGITRSSTIIRYPSGSTIAYLGSPTAMPTGVMVLSRVDSYSGQCVAAGTPGPVTVVPVTGEANLSSMWTPPFTAR